MIRWLLLALILTAGCAPSQPPCTSCVDTRPKSPFSLIGHKVQCVRPGPYYQQKGLVFEDVVRRSGRRYLGVNLEGGEKFAGPIEWFKVEDVE